MPHDKYNGYVGRNLIQIVSCQSIVKKDLRKSVSEKPAAI